MMNYEEGKVYLNGNSYSGHIIFKVLYIFKNLPEEVSFTTELAIIQLQNGDVKLKKMSDKDDLQLSGSCIDCKIPNQYHICYNCKTRKNKGGM